MSNAFLEKDFNTYRQNCNHFIFCPSYINESKLPQFDYINNTNIYTYHSYLLCTITMFLIWLPSNRILVLF